jgi:phage-related protein
MRANPIGIVITALVALGAGLVLAYKKSETFRKIVDGAFKAVKTVALSVFGWFAKYVPQVFSAVRAAISTYVTIYRTVITTAFRLIRSAVTTAVNAVRSVISSVFSAIRSVISTYVNAWRAVISGAMSAIRSVVSGGVSAVKSAIGGLSSIAGRVRGYFNSAKSAAQGALDRLIGVVRGVPGRVTGALGNLGSLLYSKGREIIQGLIDGVLSMVGAIGSAIGKVTGAISKFLPGSPVKEGPLRVLNNGYAGKQIVRMIADGINGQRGLVQAAMGGATAFPVASASVPPARVSGGGLMGALQSAGGHSAPMVSIGTMNTTDPKAAILEMERRQSDAVALANLRSVK